MVVVRSHRPLPTKGSASRSGWVSPHPEDLGILLFSQYIETRFAADLLADDACGIGYL